MRNLSLLIDQVRRSTENVEVSDNSGISSDEIIQYFNDAQDELQADISVLNPQIFTSEQIQLSVSQQEAYNIPDDAFLGNRVDQVEYADQSVANKFFNLKQGTLQERLSGAIDGVPSFYIRRGGQILLQPIPDTAGEQIRISYQKKLPRLDIRSGTVATVVLTSNTITSLILDITAVLDASALTEEGFITVVTENGAQQMRRIPIDAVDDATGVVTVEPGFTFAAGETIVVGDFTLRGEESTTHSQMPANTERFLVDYARMRVLQRDSSNDAAEAAGIVQSQKASIIRAFSEPDRDVDYVTILDDQYLVAVDDF